MTGGGRIQDSLRVTHGFPLHCDMSDGPIRLEVNWPGNRFRLETLDTVLCLDHPVFEPSSPIAPFHTYVGYGTGQLNGLPGAIITWLLTDSGQPPWSDYAEFEIFYAVGNLVLSSAGYLQYGNQYALADRPGLTGWFDSLRATIQVILDRLQRLCSDAGC